MPEREQTTIILQPCLLSSGSLQTHLFYQGTQSGGLPQKLSGSFNTFDFPAGIPQGSEKCFSRARDVAFVFRQYGENLRNSVPGEAKG